MDRRVALVLAEARKHRAAALVSEYPADHIEVAEALEAAADSMRRTQSWRSETNLHLSLRPLPERETACCPEAGKSPSPSLAGSATSTPNAGFSPSSTT